MWPLFYTHCNRSVWCVEKQHSFRYDYIEHQLEALLKPKLIRKGSQTNQRLR